MRPALLLVLVCLIDNVRSDQAADDAKLARANAFNAAAKVEPEAESEGSAEAEPEASGGGDSDDALDGCLERVSPDKCLVWDAESDPSNITIQSNKTLSGPAPGPTQDTEAGDPEPEGTIEVPDAGEGKDAMIKAEERAVPTPLPQTKAPVHAWDIMLDRVAGQFKSEGQETVDSVRSILKKDAPLLKTMYAESQSFHHALGAYLTKSAGRDPDADEPEEVTNAMFVLWLSSVQRLRDFVSFGNIKSILNKDSIRSGAAQSFTLKLVYASLLLSALFAGLTLAIGLRKARKDSRLKKIRKANEAKEIDEVYRENEHFRRHHDGADTPASTQARGDTRQSIQLVMVRPSASDARSRGRRSLPPGLLAEIHEVPSASLSHSPHGRAVLGREVSSRRPGRHHRD